MWHKTQSQINRIQNAKRIDKLQISNTNRLWAMLWTLTVENETCDVWYLQKKAILARSLASTAHTTTRLYVPRLPNFRRCTEFGIDNLRSSSDTSFKSSFFSAMLTFSAVVAFLVKYSTPSIEIFNCLSLTAVSCESVLQNNGKKQYSLSLKTTKMYPNRYLNSFLELYSN